jgi:hypothetical protein
VNDTLKVYECPNASCIDTPAAPLTQLYPLYSIVCISDADCQYSGCNDNYCGTHGDEYCGRDTAGLWASRCKDWGSGPKCQWPNGAAWNDCQPREMYASPATVTSSTKFMLVKFETRSNGGMPVLHEGFLARFGIDRFARDDMTSDASAVFDPSYNWTNWCRDPDYSSSHAVAGVSAFDACCGCR